MMSSSKKVWKISHFGGGVWTGSFSHQKNKTKYFRLRLTDKVCKRAYRPETDLNRAVDMDKLGQYRHLTLTLNLILTSPSPHPRLTPFF